MRGFFASLREKKTFVAGQVTQNLTYIMSMPFVAYASLITSKSDIPSKSSHLLKGIGNALFAVAALAILMNALFMMKKGGDKIFIASQIMQNLTYFILIPFTCYTLYLIPNSDISSKNSAFLEGLGVFLLLLTPSAMFMNILFLISRALETEHEAYGEIERGANRIAALANPPGSVIITGPRDSRQQRDNIPPPYDEDDDSLIPLPAYGDDDDEDSLIPLPAYGDDDDEDSLIPPPTYDDAHLLTAGSPPRIL